MLLRVRAPGEPTIAFCTACRGTTIQVFTANGGKRCNKCGVTSYPPKEAFTCPQRLL